MRYLKCRALNIFELLRGRLIETRVDVTSGIRQDRECAWTALKVIAGFCLRFQVSDGRVEELGPWIGAVRNLKATLRGFFPSDMYTIGTVNIPCKRRFQASEVRGGSGRTAMENA
jgi:hypothetical protein